MAATRKKIKKIKQDPSELDAMVEFYGKEFTEVYFVRDMLADAIIAVETAPARPNYPTVERANGVKRNIFDYQNLFWTTRVRIDKNQHGNYMIGYQSASGNDTRQGKAERGAVQRDRTPTSFAPNTLNRPSSPFERARLDSQVQINQASNKIEADYEVYTDEKGHIVERFETFEVIRMK